MNFHDFEASVNVPEPPAGLTPYLLALWHDRRGGWDAAHETVQDINDPHAAWIHAYLHRKEGDESNARYWYGRAGKPFPAGRTLDEEWAEIARALLA
jgi:hypothetical protein